MMINQIALLEIMSPKEYQAIRERLGNGSGQESPGFRTLLKMYQPIWNSFKENYLDKHSLTLEKIYDSEYNARRRLRRRRIFSRIRRTLPDFSLRAHAIDSSHDRLRRKILKGRPVEILEDGMRLRFFPELWELRGEMTDRWGGVYGTKRDPLGGH